MHIHQTIGNIRYAKHFYNTGQNMNGINWNDCVWFNMIYSYNVQHNIHIINAGIRKWCTTNNT